MLSLKNISFVVKEKGKEKVILDNFSFDFNEGKIYAITGHNGSGKSTLAKIIMGIEKPTSGAIIFNGQDITNLSITKRAKMGICFAFQNPVRFKGLTAIDLIKVACQNCGNFNDYCAYLSKVGLCAREYSGRELDNKLSGGELKRIEIASCLARRAPLNIFDEPEAGIDLWSFDALTGIFAKLKSHNTTNIIISHQEKLLKTADEILVITGGKLEATGNPNIILKNLNASQTCVRLKGESNGTN